MSSCLHQLHIFHLLYVLKYVLNTPTLCARTAMLKNPSKKDKKIANGLCGLDLQYRRGFTTDAVQVADDCSRNSKSAAFECRKVECIMRYRKKALKVKLHFVTVGSVTIAKDWDLSQYAGRPCLNGECVRIGASL